MRARLSPYCSVGAGDAAAVDGAGAAGSWPCALAPAARLSTSADETKRIVRMCSSDADGARLALLRPIIPYPGRFLSSGDEQRLGHRRNEPQRAGTAEQQLD